MSRDDIMYRCAWLLMHDAEFGIGNRSVPVQVWPRGSLRYLVDMSRRIWDRYQLPLSDAIVGSLVYSDDASLRRNGAVAANVVSAYAALDAFAVPDVDRPAIRVLAREWLERAVLDLGVERAKDAASKGDHAKARALLEASVLPPMTTTKPVRLNAASPDFLANAGQQQPGAIPTGIQPLDQAWDGGYRKGEVGMVVAPTGVGKSMLMAYMIGQAALAGLNVLADTHELTVEQYRERIALSILRKGRKSLQGEPWDAAVAWRLQSAGKVAMGNVDIFPGYPSWPDLDAALDEYKRDNGAYPDVLMLDSADDIAPYGKFEKEYQSLRAAFQHLRDIAHSKDIAIWSTGQVNREGVERARVHLKHIGDAFGKAQKSHYVVGLAQTEAEKNYLGGSIANIYVLKDSLHGSVHTHITVTVNYGDGDNGYAGFHPTTRPAGNP